MEIIFKFNVQGHTSSSINSIVNIDIIDATYTQKVGEKRCGQRESLEHLWYDPYALITSSEWETHGVKIHAWF